MSRNTSLSSATTLVTASMLACSIGCGPVDLQRADTMRATLPEPLGESHLSLKWKWQSADRRTEIEPQEFASPIVVADTLFVGSTAGEFVALRAASGAVRWRKKLGPVGAAAAADRGLLYVGTSDGIMICLEANTGVERWRYTGRGVIDQAPVVAGSLLVFSSEADQVVALDALTGAFKWQYKTETPEEFVLRGHAGIRSDGALLYTGFSNGTLVALRRDNGSVAWSTSLRADAERYYDVDATPIVVGDTLYATSASGGVYGIDKQTGVIQWRTPIWDASEPTASGNVAGITSDGESLFVAVAELGTYRLDMVGNVIWRVGARGGGEPAQPMLPSSDPSLLVFTLAKDGVFIANKRSGEVLEFFDPGDGVSSAPALTADGRLFAMSNRGVLYAFDLD